MLHVHIKIHLDGQMQSFGLSRSFTALYLEKEIYSPFTLKSHDLKSL